MRSRLILVVALVAALCGTAASQELLKRKVTKTDRFDFGVGGTVAVMGAPTGSVRILPSSKNEIELTAEIELQALTETDLNTLAAVTGFITDETVGRTGIISIGTHNKLGDKKRWKKFPKHLLGLPFRIDYTIYVPKYCDLEIDGGKGDLSITGVEGSIRVNFVETTAKIEVIAGSSSIILGGGKADVAFGTRGWRNRPTDVQMANGNLTIHLPSSTSAQIDAVILRTGKIDISFPDLKPRDRKLPFTDRSIIAKAGVGGAPLKFTVGDGTLAIKPLQLPF